MSESNPRNNELESLAEEELNGFSMTARPDGHRCCPNGSQEEPEQVISVVEPRVRHVIKTKVKKKKVKDKNKSAVPRDSAPIPATTSDCLKDVSSPKVPPDPFGFEPMPDAFRPSTATFYDLGFGVNVHGMAKEEIEQSNDDSGPTWSAAADCPQADSTPAEHPQTDRTRVASAHAASHEPFAPRAVSSHILHPINIPSVAVPDNCDEPSDLREKLAGVNLFSPDAVFKGKDNKKMVITTQRKVVAADSVDKSALKNARRKYLEKCQSHDLSREERLELMKYKYQSDDWRPCEPQIPFVPIDESGHYQATILQEKRSSQATDLVHRQSLSPSQFIVTVNEQEILYGKPRSRGSLKMEDQRSPGLLGANLGMCDFAPSTTTVYKHEISSSNVDDAECTGGFQGSGGNVNAGCRGSIEKNGYSSPSTPLLAGSSRQLNDSRLTNNEEGKCMRSVPRLQVSSSGYLDPIDQSKITVGSEPSSANNHATADYESGEMELDDDGWQSNRLSCRPAFSAVEEESQLSTCEQEGPAGPGIWADLQPATGTQPHCAND